MWTKLHLWTNRTWDYQITAHGLKRHPKICPLSTIFNKITNTFDLFNQARDERTDRGFLDMSFLFLNVKPHDYTISLVTLYKYTLKSLHTISYACNLLKLCANSSIIKFVISSTPLRVCPYFWLNCSIQLKNLKKKKWIKK